MKPFKKVIGEIPLEQAHGGSGARRLILSSLDEISGNIEAVTKGYLEVGKIFDWHNHENIDEFFIVIEGEGNIEFETGEKFDYKPGDFIYNPANISHKITALGNKTNEFLFFRIFTKT